MHGAFHVDLQKHMQHWQTLKNGEDVENDQGKPSVHIPELEIGAKWTQHLTFEVHKLSIENPKLDFDEWFGHVWANGK